MDIYNTLLKTAKRYPKKSAIIFKNKSEDFTELINNINGLMEALKGLGIKRGEKIAIWLPNCPEYVHLYLAALSLGVTVVPLDVSLPSTELASILKHAEANYLIAKKDIRLEIPSLKKVITEIDGSIKRDGIRPEDINIREEELAVIIYTSGTTGRPKAVPLTYRHLDSPISTLRYFDYIEDLSVLACYIPFSHAGGLVYLLMLVCTGSTLVLGGRFSPKRFLRDVEAYKVTGSWLPPSILEAILGEEEINRVSLDSLRLIVYFGAPGHPRIFREFEGRFPHVRGITGWGLTESSAPNVLLPKDTPPEKKYKRGIIGKPAPWVEIKIVDDRGNPLPKGKIGEILLKGWFVMDGYYKEPELTSEVLRDGWLYTGDLGYLDEDGYLYITGRKKETIIVGGLNVYANEVEFVISEHPRVEEVAVVGVFDKLRGEVVKAVVVSKNGTSLSPQEIISFCRKRLPGYKVPKLVEFRKYLPKTSSGKIKKSELI